MMSEFKRERFIDTAPVVAPGEALGQSEPFLRFQERLSRVARVDRPVLLIGERGTGKELAARRLHYLSSRWAAPCVTLNCGALAPTLIESELFGYEKGAFTGAESRRAGRFEAAHNGTLFLDEIGNIPMEAQEKILRVVEYGSFERVGSTRPVEVDVRIVAATNSDLPAMAARGEFKADLLDRLSFEVLFLPPLRAREEDILLLARHFAARMAYELGREQEVEFSPEIARALQEYRWPGNIRELKNVVERAVYASDGEVIDQVVFDPFISPYENAALSVSGERREAAGLETRADSGRTWQDLGKATLREAVKDLELAMITSALSQCRFNQRQAARVLGLSYDQLRGLLRKYRDELPGR